jgi:hypothetical protein
MPVSSGRRGRQGVQGSILISSQAWLIDRVPFHYQRVLVVLSSKIHRKRGPLDIVFPLKKSENYDN